MNKVHHPYSKTLIALKHFFVLACCCLLGLRAQALSLGDLVFTTMNSDEDGWSMVALTNIPANTTVYFTDNEWDGAAFNGGESYHQWVSGAGVIPAGTVIRFAAIDNATTLNASVGTLTRATVSGSTGFGLSATEESIYAYQAASVTGTPTFISAICNTNFGYAAAGVLNNTGLSIGNGAIQAGVGGGSDFFEYSGARSGQTAFSNYLALVCNIVNWTVDTANGNFAATLPNTNAFTISVGVAPTVVVAGATGIGSNSATLNGNVTADNGSAVTERGFAYKTNSVITLGDNKTIVAGTTGAFSLTPSLNPNAQYFYKAYAINAGGTTLSSETNFWTLANTPAAPTVAGPTTNSLQVTVNGNGNPAGTTFAIHESTLNQYVQADGSLSAAVVFQTASAWGTKVVGGLSANTLYTFEVKAQNFSGTETEFSPSNSGMTASNAPVGITSVNLNNYVRVGRYQLPHPTNSVPPNSTNLLCEEASGVAYNWDTDTLFIVGDGGRSVTQVSKTGALIDTMTLALGSSPQGTEFYDTEGITYVGGGQFVFTEERDRQLVKFTYAAGTVLTRANAQTVKLGTFVPNIGTEGASFDPLTGGFIGVKEISPMGVFQTAVDFVAGTASNGSPTTENSTNLFDPALLGVTDLADVFALANLPGLTNQTDFSHLLLISQENARVLNVDRAGNVYSSLNITRSLGDVLDPASVQHEGLTMDRNGILYVVNENGGGDINHPELWVYAPAVTPNQAPTAVIITNTVNTIAENTSLPSALKVADVFLADDGLGTNTLTLSGPDAASFQIIGDMLYLAAGTTLDYETKTNYTVTVSVDDTAVGTTPDATNTYTLVVSDVLVEGGSAPTLFISEVAPWSSSGSPVLADWFEVSNAGSNTVNIAGWKIDDSSAAIGSAVLLNGITNIAPGESVIFIETADLPTAKASFLNTWFGANPPANLQIGSYTGSGLGLSTGGDGVCLFDTNSTIVARVSFGASPLGPKFATFENAAGLNGTNAILTRFSTPRVYGAFYAASDYNEVGSPGSVGGLIISEVSPWSSTAANSPVAADWFEVINTSPRSIDVSGWKMDDNSKLFSSAVFLNGVTNIAPGEAVIFIETATPATTRNVFLTNWFGANAPANLQVGSYTGSGLGLGSSGDQVNLFDGNGTLRASVTFGPSPSTAPFTTFDNTFGLNNATLTQMSALNLHGGFAAVNNTNEIGSPGIGSKIVVTEVAPWSSSGSPILADWFEISNIGAAPVDLTGWKMDDNSQSPAGAVTLTGVTNIAPGESVIFIETADPVNTKSNFLANWFGTNLPAALQIGTYTGSGVGLGSGGDQVNLYTSNNVLQASVAFGSSPVGPFATFENGAGLNGLVPALARLSTNGMNGAFVARNSAVETGSPGIMNVPNMTFALTGGNANFRWNLDGYGYRLEESSALGSWSNAAANPVLTNGEIQISVPATDQVRFFRLKLP